MRNLVVVIEMYFHNGDHLSKLVFHRSECLYENVYISGLKEGHYIKSEQPYFVTSSDGHVSIATQKYRFNYFDKDHNHLDMVEISFITECEIKEVSETILRQDDFSGTHLFGIITLSVIVYLIFAIQRGRKND